MGFHVLWVRHGIRLANTPSRVTFCSGIVMQTSRIELGVFEGARARAPIFVQHVLLFRDILFPPTKPQSPGPTPGMVTCCLRYQAFRPLPGLALAGHESTAPSANIRDSTGSSPKSRQRAWTASRKIIRSEAVRPRRVDCDALIAEQPCPVTHHRPRQATAQVRLQIIPSRAPTATAARPISRKHIPNSPLKLLLPQSPPPIMASRHYKLPSQLPLRFHHQAP